MRIDLEIHWSFLPHVPGEGFGIDTAETPEREAALTQQQVMLTTQRINVWVPLPPPDVVVVVVVVDVVTGGKGEAANRQFIPSFEVVASELLTRPAGTVPEVVLTKLV